METTTDPIVFKDDDNGYHLWITRYSGGYVLNRTRFKSVQPMTLHRARCRQMTRLHDSPYASTGAAAVKVCSTDPRALAEHAAREGVPMVKCSVCKP
jgi:hypothetical protein